MRRPPLDPTGAAEVAGSLSVAPGWRAGLLALALSVSIAVLTASWAVTAGWLAARLAVAGVVVLVIALATGSTALVGLATVPVLAGPAIGFDRPEGHAWGQTLLIGLLWYVAAELAWGSIEAREATARSSAVDQLRIREVATVVAAAVLVGLAATGLATVAPVRTVVVRTLAVVAVLACVVGVGRLLARLSRPEPTTPDP